MQRTLVGVLIGAVFLGALVWTTLQETSTTCEVCVEFDGRRACNRSSAGSRDEAIQQAQSSACSRVTGGVTQIVRCTGSAPESATCLD